MVLPEPQSMATLAFEEQLHPPSLWQVTLSDRQGSWEGLAIEYGLYATPVGDILLATANGAICFSWFVGAGGVGSVVEKLKIFFPKAAVQHIANALLGHAAGLLAGTGDNNVPVPVVVQTTPFRYKVWQALIAIPFASTITYSALARQLEMPKGSSRAVGNAVGANPIALFIPCHRVLTADAGLGGFRWGVERKLKLIEWERGFLHND